MGYAVQAVAPYKVSTVEVRDGSNHRPLGTFLSDWPITAV